MLIVDIESTIAWERMIRRQSLCLQVEIWLTEVYWLMGHSLDDRDLMWEADEVQGLGWKLWWMRELMRLGKNIRLVTEKSFVRKGLRYQQICQLAQRGHRQPTLARENPGSHLH